MNQRRQDKIVGRFGQMPLSLLRDYLHNEERPDTTSELKEVILSAFTAMFKGIVITEGELDELVEYMAHVKWIKVEGDKVTYPEQI